MLSLTLNSINMSFSIQGHINKANRLAQADGKVTQPEGEYVQTMFFDKDGHRGRLAVWEHRMEWDVFTDSMMTSHLDWNHPDCKCLDSLGSPVTILQVLSELNGQGWKFVRCYGRRINAL